MIALGLNVSLSDREREVLFLAADGLTDKEIAVRLNIGVKTVRTYWERMREKLGAASRTQCLAMALRSAYEAVQKSEERLRVFVDNMPVMFSAYDERLDIIMTNKEFERVSGYPVETITSGSKFLEKAYPDNRLRNRRHSVFTSNLGEYRDLELPLTCADGTHKTIAWSSGAKAAPIDGWHSWAIGIDVTEKRNAEEKLVGSETRYRQLLESSNQGIWIIDTDYRTTFANQRLLSMLGLSSEEILGHSILEFNSENDPEILRDLLGNGQNSGSRVTFNFKFKRKRGDVLYAAVDVSPLVDAEGNLTGHSAVLQDISHQKWLERRYQSVSDAYQKLLQMSRNPAMRFKPDLSISWANFQLNGGPIVGMSSEQLTDVLQPSIRWDFELKRAFEFGEHRTFDAQVNGKDGLVKTTANLVVESASRTGVSSILAILDTFELL